MKNQLIPIERVEKQILLLRGEKVLLGQQLAELYGVPVKVKVLLQSVKRNRNRFPDDFMFQLSRAEFDNLKSQFVTSSWGGLRRALPYAFTEQGVAMLSSVFAQRARRAGQRCHHARFRQSAADVGGQRSLGQETRRARTPPRRP